MLENGLSIDLTEIEQFIRGQGLGSLFPSRTWWSG